MDQVRCMVKSSACKERHHNRRCNSIGEKGQVSALSANQVQSKSITAVDLFSGCGGMSLGFENAGFKVLAAFDNWTPAVEVYRKNFDHPIFKHDLSDIDASVPLVREFAPTVIFGGPPCQDFSTAGHQDENGGRAILSVAFAKIVSRVRPQWFVMENVATIRNTRSFKRACDTFREAGYGLTCKVLNAAYCGVPQIRKRMFVIGGIGESDDFLGVALDKGLSEKPLTIRDYLGDSLGIDHYFRVPTNYSRRGVFSIDEPSMTIRAVDRPIPPGYKGNPNDSAPVSETRILTPKERSYIQTFPEEFEFFGSKSDVNTMIGNAVPVNLANYVARTLMGYISSKNGGDA
ncbi:MULTISPECIES: DNA cytosine methyltransferase [Thermophilibacter]|uniref:DNA cytosine methyltransferase n=1 Tax=Thermophilibacter TaxID=2847307 RepID=UPI0021AC5CDC|nr:DNA cytosine methyltransferase [Thermophilibacter sp. ET337]MCR8907971.1 DNA cytosine methyltransferase [Thermophilibacter sp. ET337]